jgi:hypothetical protein
MSTNLAILTHLALYSWQKFTAAALKHTKSLVVLSVSLLAAAAACCRTNEVFSTLDLPCPLSPQK